jgi:hypothetical protein
MGAVASGGVRFLNDDVVAGYRISQGLIDAVAARELEQIRRLEETYRVAAPGVDVRGRDLIIVDDGLATGATMRAAVLALRRIGVGRIAIAVPVGARETCENLRAVADELICLHAPGDFRAVGLWYEDFGEVSDSEVRALLESASGVEEREVEIDAKAVTLAGSLSVPKGARALVLFAHGSGSSRHSPRNRYVASALRSSKIATLLMDLLTAGEERAEAASGHLGSTSICSHRGFSPLPSGPQFNLQSKNSRRATSGRAQALRRPSWRPESRNPASRRSCPAGAAPISPEKLLRESPHPHC